jgi:hypothetical protein
MVEGRATVTKTETKLCECGCGLPTRIATKTHTSQGHVKGQPIRFVHGHNSRAGAINLTGRRFGRLLALEPTARRSGSAVIWKCMCDCGTLCYAATSRLNAQRVQSCGCLQQECRSRNGKFKTTHGHSTNGVVTAEYKAYAMAKYRCTNPHSQGFADYGGRGIEFRFASFEEFIAHIGLKPSPDLELDRIDNDGHYEVGNVRWADHSTQMSNRRAYHWKTATLKRAA